MDYKYNLKDGVGLDGSKIVNPLDLKQAGAFDDDDSFLNFIKATFDDTEESNSLSYDIDDISVPGAVDIFDLSDLQARKDEEEKLMLELSAGRAWKLVENIVKLKTYCSSEIIPIAVDAMVDLAERFIDQQKKFFNEGKDCNVTIAYHYTTSMNLERIRRNGLLSDPERRSLKIHSRSGGAVFGDGIYTANNALAFRSFGYGNEGVGLMVAVLKGNTSRITRRGLDQREDLDSGVGNKVIMDTSLSLEPLFNDELVLKKASQVLPVFSFPAKLTRQGAESQFVDDLWHCHLHLQLVIDHLFHSGKPTPVTRILPPDIDKERDNLRAKRRKLHHRHLGFMCPVAPSQPQQQKQAPKQQTYSDKLSIALAHSRSYAQSPTVQSQSQAQDSSTTHPLMMASPSLHLNKQNMMVQSKLYQKTCCVSKKHPPTLPLPLPSQIFVPTQHGNMPTSSSMKSTSTAAKLGELRNTIELLRQRSHTTP